MMDRAGFSGGKARAGARWRIAGVVLLAAVVYLVGNRAVALWDRDEPRNAMTARGMLRSGDWVVPRLYDEPRTAKPPLMFWLQATVMGRLGENAFSARLPSAAAMVVTLCVVGAAAWRMAGPRRAGWAVLVLASSVMVMMSAKASTTDSVLLLWITAAQLCVYAIWRGRGRWWVWLGMGAAVGLAGLTKGPVVLGVMGTTLMALWLLGRGARRRGDAVAQLIEPGRRRRALLTLAKCSGAILVAAAVCAPWLYLVQERSPGWVGASVTHDVLRRVAQPLEGHKGPPGYHLAAIWLFFLPWSLLLPLAVALAWKRRHLPQLRFALAASLGPWVMFELVRTKLPHYMLPTYPWLALMVGDAIVRCLRGQHPDLRGRAFVAVATVLATVAGIASLLPAGASVYFGESVAPGLVVAVGAAVYLAAVVVLFHRRHTAAGLTVLGLGAMAAWGLAWAVYLPRAQFLRLSVRTADVLRHEGATGPGAALMLDYKEPSLAFYQGGSIREHPATRLTADHLAGDAAWFVITAEVWDKTSADVRARVEVVERFDGLAYADGRKVEVIVVKSAGASGRGPGD